MTVTLRKPTSPEYKNFSREVKKRAKGLYSNFTYDEEEVSAILRYQNLFLEYEQMQFQERNWYCLEEKKIVNSLYSKFIDNDELWVFRNIVWSYVT